MKKQVALLTTALLATSFVLGATSCASKDVNKLMVSQVSTQESTQNVSALWNDNASLYMETLDKYGLVVAETKTRDSEDKLTSKTYKLYDLKANAAIAGASVTVNKPGANDLSYVDYEMKKVTDGFYYSVKFVRQCSHVPEGQEKPDWTDKNKWEPQAGSVGTYTLYGKNGVIAENLKGIVDTNNGTFTTKDGEVYYVDVNGDVKSTKDPLAKYMTATSNYNKVGDYYYNSQGNGLYNIYDANGNYVRNFDMYTEFEMPMTMGQTTWTVGNRLFVQYYEMLPENEKKYDVMMTMAMYEETAMLFYDGMQKYNVVTKYYDVEKDKVKEIDFDYIVNNDVSQDNESIAVLEVSEIKDKQITKKGLVQSFNEKGKVAVDLQKLVPGATNYSYNKKNDYVKLSDGDMDYICQGKEVIGKFPTGKVTYSNNVAYTKNSNGSFLYIYNLSGSVAEAIELDDVVNNIDGCAALMNGDIVYESDGGIYVYDTRNKSSNCVAVNNNGEQIVVDVNNAYVKSEVTANEKTKVTYSFLVGEAGDITVVKEDNDSYNLYAYKVGNGILYSFKANPKEEAGATEEKANVYTAYYVSTPIVK